MVIRINGKTADITLDKEKTIADVMTALGNWFGDSGHRISGLSVDGQPVDSSSLETALSKELSSVKTLDVFTNSLSELTAESLLNLLSDIKEYEGLNYEDKVKFKEIWETRPQALFAAEQMPDLYNIFVNCFSGTEYESGVVYSITEERLREINEPAVEAGKLESLVEETCARLTDLPLDVQTGKEGRAAQTIQIFSGISEKLFRLLNQLNFQGYLSQSTEDKNHFTVVIGDFGKVVKELLNAYEKQDTVLIGDLCEYEAVPKVKELYGTIIKNIQSVPVKEEK